MSPITSGLHVVFNRQNTRYALPLPIVKEVIYLPELVSVDNMPDHIVGIFNYHGQAVPVMNLDNALGHVSFRYKISDNILLVEWDGFVCGLIIDDIRDLLDIQSEDMESSSEETGQAHPLIAHVMPYDDGVINILHPLPIPQDRNAIEHFIESISFN